KSHRPTTRTPTIIKTDSNQAEDISPLGSSPLPDPQSKNQCSGEKERKNYDSADSIQKHNNSASSHLTNARLLRAFAASASRLPKGCFNDNTVLGDDALLNNTTGTDNTANGLNALFNNTEGSFNTATGSDALFQNTTGSENTGY